MCGEISERTWREARAVEALVFDAFRGVTREGGVSWHQTHVLDYFGTAEELAAASLKDTEANWEALVDDQAWIDLNRNGVWAFLDAAGFRYYLAAEMVLMLRGWFDEWLVYNLTIKSQYTRDRLCLFTPQQKHVVARFLRVIIVMQQELGDDIWGPCVSEAYKSYWRDWDKGGRVQ